MNIASSCSYGENYKEFYFHEIESGYAMRASGRMFNKYKGVLRIPETYKDKPVLRIESMDSVFGRGITEIVGSKNLQIVGAWTFAGTDRKAMPNLIKVEFPRDGKLDKIETMAFYWCKNLTTVIVPENFRCFESGVFERCDSLTNLIIFNPTPPLKGDLFNMTTINNEYFHSHPNSSFTVYVPDDAIEVYRDSIWDSYKIAGISNVKELIAL